MLGAVPVYNVSKSTMSETPLLCPVNVTWVECLAWQFGVNDPNYTLNYSSTQSFVTVYLEVHLTIFRNCKLFRKRESNTTSYFHVLTPSFCVIIPVEKWLNFVNQTFMWLQIAGCISDRSHTQRVNTFPMADITPSRNNMKERKLDAPVRLNINIIFFKFKYYFL